MLAQLTCRASWMKQLGLVVVAMSGLAVGFYYSATNADPSRAGAAADSAPPDSPSAMRFPLAALDMKDQIEAPDLAVDATGRVFLCWASQSRENERSLFLTRSDDAGKTFAVPHIVTNSGIVKSVSAMKGRTMSHQLRMLPHLVAVNDQLHLSWVEALPGNKDVRMVMASSSDGGGTFSQAVPVHRGEGARTTFTSFAAGQNGTLVCSWLDKRNSAQQVYASVRPAGAAAFAEEQVVHSGDDEEGVCPCCPTASVVAPDGAIYVAFRNLSSGYRDIAVGCKKTGQTTFTGPFPVVPSTWAFDGCPHDGPSLAIVGNALHIVWMDAHTGSQRCYYGAANLADMRFTAAELHSIPAGTQGNAKLCADKAGTLHAVWEESLGAEAAHAGSHRHQDHGPKVPVAGTGAGRVIMYAQRPLGAATFSSPRPVAARPDTYQTRPCITSTPAGTLVIAWNELDESGKAVVVTTLGSDRVALR